MTASARRVPGRGVRAALVATAFGAFATTASGQAWAPPAGVGSVSLLFQHVDHTSHFLADGSKLNGYDSVSWGALLAIDYAFTDRLSATAGVSYVGAKYIGPEPSFFAVESDECHCWNTGWQDAGFTLRYNVLNGAVALTPSVSYGLPTHAYPYVGEAVLGRRLHELRLGLDAGWRLDPLTSRLSVYGRYSYAFVEKVADLNLDRSDLQLSLLYQFHPRLSASVDVYSQWTHGGLRSTEFTTDEQWAEYDRIVKDNFFHIGATLIYSFKALDVWVSYIDFVSGTDTHQGRAISVGIGFPFQL